MARKPTTAATPLARFAALLARHLAAGTRPGEPAGEPWTDAGFASVVQSSREKNDFASPRSVSNWRKGQALPTEIEPILRALFGSVNRSEPAREALRRAFGAARDAKAAATLARAKAKPDRAGGQWIVKGDAFTLDRTARPSDRRAAADPLRARLQRAIRADAAELAERAKRLANTRTWGRLATVAAAFHALTCQEPGRMPDLLGEAYAQLLRLGQLLETDIRVQRDPQCADDPLDADIRGVLTDLLRTAAPWLRGFPTVGAWDDAAGKALVRESLFQPARDFVRIARQAQAISERDAAEIAILDEAADGQDFQGSKAGSRAVGTVRNLMIAEAEAVAADRVAATAVRPLAVRRAMATLKAAETELEAFSESLPPDLRQALRAVVAAAGEADETDGPGSPEGATAEAPIPEDVEVQARAMILKGQAPPSAWRPFVRMLDFSFTDLRDLTPLAALTGLQTLDLTHTQVGDVAPLAALTGLQTLYLPGTQVGDVAPLAALTGLLTLDLRGTQVSDVELLAHLKARIFHDIPESGGSKRSRAGTTRTKPPKGPPAS